MTSIGEVSYNSRTIVSSLTEEQYIDYILHIVNRILNEKLYNIVEKKENGKIEFSIQLKYCEWYLELDDEIRYNVESNLQDHILRQIKIICNTMNNENMNDIDNNEDSQQNNKRPRVNI